MTVDRVVLDAAGLDGVASEPRLRALLERTVERGGEIWCAALTIAEVARGPHRTARVHHTLTRHLGGRPIRVADTDVRLALLVGALLHESGRGSEDIVDAHAVALCAHVANALVITSDPDDVSALALHLPGVRVQCRRPDLTA